MGVRETLQASNCLTGAFWDWDISLQHILLGQAKIYLQFPSYFWCSAVFVTQHLETSSCPSGRCAGRSGRQAGAHGRAPWGSRGAGGVCSPSAAQPRLRGSLPVSFAGGSGFRCCSAPGETPVSPPREGRRRWVPTLYLTDKLHPCCIDGKGMAAEKLPGDGQSNEPCPGEGVSPPGLGGCWAGSPPPALLWVCFKQVVTRCAFGSFQQGIHARGF